MTRAFFVWLHRWTGLVIAGFLIVAGLTGSLLAFYGELTRLLAPEIYAAASASTEELDVATLAARAELLAPQARVNNVYVGYKAPVAEIGVEAKPGAPDLDYDFIYLDRRTGAELGRMLWGAFPTSRATIMPFVYQLHSTLAAGETGSWIMGWVALFWALDCFVGFYLTLPASGERSNKSFAARWRPAWLIKASASFFRFNFDLHRAGGLWLWPLLLVIAWSGVSLNLGGVYARVTSLIFDYQPPYTAMESETMAPLDDRAPMLWAEAGTTARRLMAQQARQEGFEVEREVALNLNRENGVYEYRVRSSRDIGDKSGSTALWFDAFSGEMKMLALPTGARAGNTITTWLVELHKANIYGLPYKILLGVAGLIVMLLSATGIIIWSIKRSARQQKKKRMAARPALAE
ncbi:MAG: PepSY domain-containing protein [Methylocystis sp.]|nr:PepSY domain-containing protein [Methylocystis sp.]